MELLDKWRKRQWIQTQEKTDVPTASTALSTVSGIKITVSLTFILGDDIDDMLLVCSL